MPLLQAANQMALGYAQQLPGMLAPLQSLYQNLPSIQPTISGLQQQFGGLPGQLQSQFGGLPAQLQRQFGQLPQQLMGLTRPLQQTATGYLRGIIGSQGRLSPEASRDVAQQTRTLANQYGTGRQLGTLGTELLNRQGAREARYGTALGQYNQATGQIGALSQLAQGLGTNLAQTRQGLGTGLAQATQGLGTGLAGFLQNLRGQDITQRLGLAGGMQGLQTGGLNQLGGLQQVNTGTFATTTNPILNYLSNLFGGNLQGSIAQAQINSQQNLAGQNKMGDTIGGIASAVGPIIGGLAMSDERVKTKIRDTGITTQSGVPLKTWEYKTRPGVRFLGPLAQDVEKRLPERVLTEPLSGIKMVTGFPVIQVSEIKRKAA